MLGPEGLGVDWRVATGMRGEGKETVSRFILVTNSSPQPENDEKNTPKNHKEVD